MCDILHMPIPMKWKNEKQSRFDPAFPTHHKTNRRVRDTTMTMISLFFLFFLFFDLTMYVLLNDYVLSIDSNKHYFALSLSFSNGTLHVLFACLFFFFFPTR